MDKFWEDLQKSLESEESSDFIHDLYSWIKRREDTTEEKQEAPQKEESEIDLHKLDQVNKIKEIIDRYNKR